MLAFKEKEGYKEGTTWTNFTPYGSEGPWGGDYQWKGGPIYNATRAVGCMAFTFILSDAAFDNLRARAIENFTFEDVKVGDILRMGGHSVIVLQKGTGGVVVAEANYNKTVHWGRAISASDVESANFIITRYPEGYVSADEPGTDEVIETGTEGTLSWSVTQAGVLTISGSGSIPNYSANSSPTWNNCNFNTVEIKDGVTEIGDYAFYQKSGLLSIYIPDGVTRIGQNAFAKSGIMAVTIPGSVGEIGNNAFQNCENLTSVSITEGLETIGQDAFRGCMTLAYIDFPASVTSIGAGAFMDCVKMYQVRFMPSDIPAELGDNLFSRCQNLTSVILPRNATSISKGMFQSCTLLPSLYIPASVKDIGGYVSDLFEDPFGSSGLREINFEGSKEVWNSLVPPYFASSHSQIKINYNVPYDDPFAVDPDDPGDFIPGEDPEHEHQWATGWIHDETYHWHECEVADCPIVNNNEKDGYEEHQYDDWVVDKEATSEEAGSKHRNCKICQYEQTESIPVTGDDSNKPGDSENPGDDSNKPGDSENPGDDSNKPGDSENPGGDSNKPGDSENPGGDSNKPGDDSSNSGDHKDPDVPVATPSKPTRPTPTRPSKPSRPSNSSSSRKQPSSTKMATRHTSDGTTIMVATLADGTMMVVTTDVTGKTNAEVKLSAAAIEDAQKQGRVVALPISPVTITRDITTAATLTVYSGKEEPIKVAIPLSSPTSGTVALMVNADGSVELIRSSLLVDNNLIVALPNGAKVKIVDNSKTFTDVPTDAWFASMVDFVTARDLFYTPEETAFMPGAPMTYAMLTTSLARLDGINTNVGGVWYEKGMEWANLHNIGSGADLNGSFNDEELMVMLWKYAGAPETTEVSVDGFDPNQASEAQKALVWAINNEIVDSAWDRQGVVDRARAAYAVMNLVKYIVTR